jgi:glycosyltransferase involved in cell wall biosynthesis
MPDDILVSCLLVTLASPERIGFARRAIAAYRAQTHPKRELVIVTDPGPTEAKAALAAHLAALGRDDIRMIEPASALTLGGLRNLARDSARGEVHCQWDDDDLHHPERIERQLGALEDSGAEAVCLQEVMQFFPATRALYCTNWRATEYTAFPGSLMCKARSTVRYPESGPESRLGEDSVVCAQFLRLGALHALAGAPHLFVYLSHGANSWPDDHHRMLANRLGVSRGLLRRREAALREDLRPFDFGAGEVTMRGPNGAAFTFPGVGV